MCGGWESIEFPMQVKILWQALSLIMEQFNGGWNMTQEEQKPKEFIGWYGGWQTQYQHIISMIKRQK
jgi:hypothetical protein